jgi:cytochrome c-type biogenesis protein CcmE
VDPTRRRKVRLVVALTAAVLLAGALVYTTFAGASPAEKPSQLLAGVDAARSYALTGVVERGTLHRSGDRLAFRVRDRDGRASVAVSYSGAVPEPFREGREIIVQVRRDGSGFAGQPGSLVTKCPSKFTAKRGT